VSGGRTREAVEWPTVGLLLAFIAAWLAVVLGHESIPWWVAAPILVYLGGLWMSLGHELLHGHPTRWNWVNTTVGSLPLQLWLPFPRYKTWHVLHHQADLTDPIDDPESYYVQPDTWRRAGRLRRRWMLVLRTLPGRLTFGVLRGIPRFWWRELPHLRTPAVALQWGFHLVLATAFGWWLFGVVGVSPWLYVPAFVLGGSACTQLRSFLEHCAVPEGTRSAVVKAGPVMSLLFLNNNLHHTHHALPDLAWYRIPAAHTELGSDAIAAAGAGLYTGGYLEVWRRFAFHPFCQPDHPLSPGARPYGSRGID